MTPLPGPRNAQVNTADGVHLAVLDYGPRTADHTVVFLHGFCLDHTCWAGQIGYLRRRYGHAVRIIAYDHRGHGNSESAPIPTYTVEQLAADLADVLVALDVSRPPVFVGHSMGAMTALQYLSRPRPDRPVDPHALVLLATAAGKLAERGLGRLLHSPARHALCGLASHVPGRAVKPLSAPVCAALGRWNGCDQAHRATLAALAARALANTQLPTIAGFLAALCTYDQYSTLGSIRAHTVVVSGGADLLTPPAHSHDLVAGIAGAEHVHLPHAGHMLAQEAPAVVHAAIRRVIAHDRSHAPACVAAAR